MRPEQTEFAIVPVWVATHEAVKGNGTRLAVYVAIRIVAFERPDHEWRSDRDLAVDIGELVGVSAERARKHLADLREAGIVLGGAGRITLPMDETGSSAGSSATQLGSPQTQTGSSATQSPITKRTEDTARAEVGHRATQSPNIFAESLFAEFWAVYPRKTARKTALKAYTAALKRTSAETILDAAKLYAKRNRASDVMFLPYASSWLNADRWEDESAKPVEETYPDDWEETR